MSSNKAEYLVVDSGGFIKNAPLRDLATNLVTLQEVVSEIRDKDTRQRLQVLPYELEFKKPSSEGMKKVSDFAKKTGDYASLSLTDLSLLAVTYDLEVSKVGASHLRTEPVVKKTTEFYKPVTDKAKINKTDSKIAGFYFGDGHEMENKENLTQIVEGCREGTEMDVVIETAESNNFDSFNYWREPVADIEDLDMIDTEVSLTAKQMSILNRFLLTKSFFFGFEVSSIDISIANLCSSVDKNLYPNLYRWLTNTKTYTELPEKEVDLDKLMDCVTKGVDFDEKTILKNTTMVGHEIIDNEESSEDLLDDSSREDDDGGYSSDQENDEDEMDEDDGWITPGNVKHKKKEFSGGIPPAQDKKVMVACMTTDFAMQNVLKQIGLNILGTDGMVIKETKTWILRCYGCFTTTPIMDKQFCPKCGNKTLKRVSVTVNSDGSQQIHISTRRPLSTKGKKFSLPAPKGGKHAVNPRLFEDQREPQQRISKKALAKTNPMSEDYLAGSSPFVTKDVTSKSAMLGLHGRGKGNAEVPGMYWARKNPNAVKKNTGNRKKNVV